MYDAVIVGGGPAGLSAAIYLARAKCKVLVIEKEKIGGQITITADVVNYPGTGRVSGSELAAQMEQQARGFGAEFVSAEVIGLKLDQDVKELETTAGTVQALSVILATGANPRKVGFLGEKKFQGRGVAYCATCDAEFFSGMDIFVIGGSGGEHVPFALRKIRHHTRAQRQVPRAADNSRCACQLSEYQGALQHRCGARRR